MTYKFGIKLNCIQNILQSTLLPNEIIISLNNVQIIGEQLVDNLENKYKKKGVKIIRNYSSLTEGQNRQKGSGYSSCDLILYTDADDLMHPQKIEIIDYFFKKFPNIVHINHEFSYGVNTKVFDLKKINFADNNEVSKICQNLELYNNLDWYNLPNKQVHTAHTSIRKKILNSVSWDLDKTGVGQDSIFCRKVCNKFNKSIILFVPLSFYSKQFSTYK